MIKSKVFDIQNEHPQNTMVGLFFLELNEQNEPQRQGYVIRKINDEIYAIQLFDWLLGDESIVRLVKIEDMMTWHFYSSNEQMLFQMEHRNNGVKRDNPEFDKTHFLTTGKTRSGKRVEL